MEQPPETCAAGRAVTDGMGAPGHTPFRSSRFMPAADDMDNSQVTLLSSVISLPKSMRLHGRSPSIGGAKSSLSRASRKYKCLQRPVQLFSNSF